MLKFTLKIIIWSSLLLISVVEFAISSSPENISRVQAVINQNFQKTQGNNSNSMLTNRANINRIIPEIKNVSEVLKPLADKKNHTRNFSSYEVHEPKKHNEREVKIVYEASKSSANILPNEKEVKKAPYYNTSIKYSSKYSLTPEETRNINITENAIEYDEDDDDDYHEEEEEEDEEEEEEEAEKQEEAIRKPAAIENITRSLITKKDREELTEKSRTQKNNGEENIETTRSNHSPRRLNLASEIKASKNYPEKRNYTRQFIHPDYLPQRVNLANEITESKNYPEKRNYTARQFIHPDYLPQRVNLANEITESKNYPEKRNYTRQFIHPDYLPQRVNLANEITESKNYPEKRNYTARQFIHPDYLPQRVNLANEITELKNYPEKRNYTARQFIHPDYLPQRINLASEIQGTKNYLEKRNHTARQYTYPNNLPQRVNLANEINEAKNYPEKRNYTVRQFINPDYLPQRINLASETQGTKNYLEKRNQTARQYTYPDNLPQRVNLVGEIRETKNYPEEKNVAVRQRVNPKAKLERSERIREKEEITERPRLPIHKEKSIPKSEKRNDIFPGPGNYYITSSSRINKPQKPHREPDLKNEQSRYYWKDEEKISDDEEVEPYRRDPVSSLKVLPTEPVKILEDEIITSHPYEEPQPVSFSSIVYNNPDGESTSELSGSYYENAPNAIQDRVDVDVEDHESEEQEEEDEISENSMEDTKSVPYTTPNYQSIQTPLNRIKFKDSYAFLNPFAKQLNNFPYEYEKANQNPIIYNAHVKSLEEDVPYRASLYPNKATLEKPNLREESQEDDSPEENNEKYRLNTEEVRQKEKNVWRNPNELSEDIPQHKESYYNKNLPNADDSPEHRPNNYKQASDTTEQYSDNVKNFPKASLFNYNISSRQRYPYQSVAEPPSRIRVNQDQSNFNPSKSKPPKPYYNYRNETSHKPSIPLPTSYMNVTKEHYQDVPVTSQNKYNYRNEENNINSRRPQKFSHVIEEDEPKQQTIVKPAKNENVRDNSNEQTEVREPERNNYFDYSANNIFSPEVKQTFESLDENDEMYQEILSNIQSLFGTRINNLNPTADDKASFSKPLIPVDYQSHLQPQFEENSYENLKRRENENDDDEENRSEDIEDESEDIEDEESDSNRYEDENESEEIANYDDADDDGSEVNSNVQKVRSTERYKPKPKNKKKYKKKITKEKPKKVENFKTQTFHVGEQGNPSVTSPYKHKYPPLNQQEIDEEIQNEEKEPLFEATTASYKNILKHQPKENTLIRPHYGATKLIIKDVHSSPVDQKTIRVIVPKLITKDNVAIPQTHRQKLIIRKQNSLFK